MSRKFEILLFGVVASMIFVGCSNSTSADEQQSRDYADIVDDGENSIYDSTGELDLPTPVKKSALSAHELEDARLIREFYGHCVFNSNCEDDYAREHCSRSMLARLTKAYVEKTGRNDSYGYWIFSSDISDGDGESIVLRVTPSGNGWYQVDYLDNGIVGSVNVLVAGGKIADLD